jgi:glutamate-1-semialdehyde 2,1-aminomutase
VRNRPIVFDHETAKRAAGVIAQGALTNSKRPASFVEGVYPTHLVGGKGARVQDTTGRWLHDFICGLGTNLLGYGQPTVTEAAIRALWSGATLSLSSTAEIELGERVREIMPFVERIKLLKSGSEGCTAAVRIGRAATGRAEVLSEGYHGWHDEFVHAQPPALGIAGTFPLRAMTSLDDVSSKTAAVIIEPVITDFSPERIEWLKRLREACTRNGVVLIFDETITGLRFPGYSCAQWAGVSPDIIIFGKAVANGLPLSVVGGRREVMECGEYFVSSSFAGERASIAAACATIKLLQGRHSLHDLWASGKEFQRRFNELLAPQGVRIEGYPTRGVLAGDPMAKSLFMQESVKAGLLFGASWFYAFPHMDELDAIFSTLKNVVLKLETGEVRLEGKMPQSPFAQKMRDKT